jgi:hypothetical protein
MVVIWRNWAKLLQAFGRVTTFKDWMNLESSKHDVWVVTIGT